ncbi:hypothetical protein [Micromonospora globbae]|uniref:Uncharacterized protein n=1 Tax=Micromonospora globbae TaxID=1894969 RepID=A0A420F246_9ACTN|nr:hypothetical protein [Micromonospora globbae]RKF27052.1 hypothetical protein D7I43_11225 [Micromonospora globbae]
MEKTTDPAQVEHPSCPRWCAKGRLCVGESLHHSRPLVATPEGAQDAVRVWLEKAHTLDVHSIVLETTVDGDTHYAYLLVEQARILRHQLGRLIKTAGGTR